MNHRLLFSSFAMLSFIAPCVPALAQSQSQPPAAADAPIPLVYETTARETPPISHRNTCTLRVAVTEDQRQNTLTIGANLRGPLVTTEAGPWITDSLLHLGDFGFAVERATGNAPPADGLLVKTAVTRAYTWQVGLKIFGMIALKAQFIDKNGVLQEKYYRAHGDKTNVWGAPSEYVTTLNYGINNLLRVMAEDLTKLCQGTKVEQYSYAGPDAKPPAK